jgi:predicted ester cyclase
VRREQDGRQTPSDPVPPTPAAAPVTSADAEVAAHIDVIKQRIAASNARDWDTWQSLHTSDAVRTAPGLPGPVQGSQAMRERIEELFETFPDYTLELIDAFGSGDRLVVRIRQSATMQGPLDLGGTVVPPTGRKMGQDWVALVRFKGDKISEFYEFYDNYELLLQLGLAGP